VMLNVNTVKESVLNFVFPTHCVECNTTGSFICNDCLKKLHHIQSPYCHKCGLPFSSSKFVHDCYCSIQGIDGIRSLYLYEGSIRRAIYAFKYGNLRAISHYFARMLFENIGNIPITGEVLVPVPLHNKRLRQRGYNQAALLSKELGKLTGIAVNERTLYKIVDTKSQTQFNFLERRENTREAFACRDQRLTGKRVILIDDVCTTGATLSACAETLKKNGTYSVWGLTIARDVQK
jgi:ComF family protein